MRSLLGSLLLVASGCQPTTPPQPPPQPPDASDAAPGPMPPSTPCQVACAALAAAGCPEGHASDCAEVLGRVEAARLVRTPSGEPLTCAAVATAKSQSDARAQGISCGAP